jgi:flagellar hook assembly protein FlgD
VNPSTTIEFALPEAGPVRLAVYAANGRELARLLDERLPAGPARVEWDGRDSSGRALPSGLYFLRLEGKEFAETAKITVLR